MSLAEWIDQAPVLDLLVLAAFAILAGTAVMAALLHLVATAWAKREVRVRLQRIYDDRDDRAWPSERGL